MLVNGLLDNVQPCKLSEQDIIGFLRLYPDQSYNVEPKFDGERVLVTVPSDGRVKFQNRYGTVYNLDWFPDLKISFTQSLRSETRPLILDAEFYSLAGKQNIYQFLRDRRGSGMGLALSIFDLLQYGNQDLRGVVWRHRRQQLDQLFPIGVAPVGITQSWRCKTYDEIFQWYMYATQKLGFEGVVVKPDESIYADGKWAKWKKKLGYDVVLLAVKKTGAYMRDRPHGTSVPRAYLIGFINDKGQTEAWGDCSAGYSVIDHTQLTYQGEEDEQYYYLEPTYVVEILCHSVLPGKKFREPRFYRPRSDKKPEECKPPDGHFLGVVNR